MSQVVHSIEVTPDSDGCSFGMVCGLRNQPFAVPLTVSRPLSMRLLSQTFWVVHSIECGSDRLSYPPSSLLEPLAPFRQSQSGPLHAVSDSPVNVFEWTMRHFWQPSWALPLAGLSFGALAPVYCPCRFTFGGTHIPTKRWVWLMWSKSSTFFVSMSCLCVLDTLLRHFVYERLSGCLCCFGCRTPLTYLLPVLALFPPPSSNRPAKGPPTGQSEWRRPRTASARPFASP